MLKALKNKKKDSSKAKTFSEVMIVVDNSETVTELSIVKEYLEEFKEDYSLKEISFAKEHLLEKIEQLKQKKT